MTRLLGICILLSLPFIGYIYYMGGVERIYIPGLHEPLPLVVFNQKTPMRVQVVDSQLERMRGLSGRESLKETEGMLFVFDKSDYHGIWMKDMRLSIDIIWINEEGVVVDIAENVRPDTYPRVFEPKLPSRFVLETNAYYTDSFSINVGDQVSIPEWVLPDDLKKN